MARECAILAIDKSKTTTLVEMCLDEDTIWINPKLTLEEAKYAITQMARTIMGFKSNRNA